MFVSSRQQQIVETFCATGKVVRSSPFSAELGRRGAPFDASLCTSMEGMKTRGYGAHSKSLNQSMELVDVATS
jgi:hypothetical protein